MSRTGAGRREPGALAAVSFDVTHTLLAIPRVAAIYRQVLARHGVAADETELARVLPLVWREISCRVGYGENRFRTHPQGARGFWRDFLDRACALLETAAPGPFAAAELYDRFAQPESWYLYPDVAPALDRLAARGFRLAVVSNFDQRLPRLLEAFELGPRFEAVVYSEQVGVEKPHPAIFEALLDRLGLPPNQVLHVGDTRREDVEGARAVGLEALWLDRQGGRGDLRSLAELAPRLGQPPASRTPSIR